MKVKGMIDNVKNAGEDRVRVAFTLADSAISGNFNKLMTAGDAKAESYFPGDEVEVDISIKSTKRAPASTQKAS